MTTASTERYAGYWNWEIALYRGDQIIDQGTIKEVADRRNVRKETIYFYTTPTGQRRASRSKNPAKGLVAIRTDLEGGTDDN